MICKNCGAKNEDGAKFCLNCGNNLAEQEAVIFCTKCFNVVDETGKFCEKCGAPVASDFTEEKMMEHKSNIAKDGIYQKAIIKDFSTATAIRLNLSLDLFKSIEGYKDASELYNDYAARLEDKLSEESMLALARRQKMKKVLIATVPLCCILLVGAGFGFSYINNNHEDLNNNIQEGKAIESNNTTQTEENQNPAPTQENENPAPAQTDKNSGKNTNISQPSDNTEPIDEPSIEDMERERTVDAVAELLASGDGYSKSGLIEELVLYQGFFREDAEYAADNCGADWNLQAVMRANTINAYDREELVGKLTNAYGFTEAQANYAADSVGF